MSIDDKSIEYKCSIEIVHDEYDIPFKTFARR